MRIHIQLLGFLLLATNPCRAQWDPQWVGTWRNENFIVSITPNLEKPGQVYGSVIPVKEESVNYELQCTVAATICTCTSSGVAEGWNLSDTKKSIFPQGTKISFVLYGRDISASQTGKLNWYHSTKDMAGDYGRWLKTGWERIHIPARVDSASYFIVYKEKAAPQTYRIASSSFLYEGTFVTAYFINASDLIFASFHSYGGQTFFIKAQTDTLSYKSLVTQPSFSNRYTSTSEDGKNTEAIEIKKNGNNWTAVYENSKNKKISLIINKYDSWTGTLHVQFPASRESYRLQIFQEYLYSTGLDGKTQEFSGPG